MNPQHILIVDDEPDIRQLIGEILQDEGYQVATAADATQARTLFRQQKPDVVLLDIWMPGEDGISLLKTWREQEREQLPPVIMISGHGTIETAVEATRLGAFDFIEKPLSTAKLLLTTDNALRIHQLESENQDLKRRKVTDSEIIGSSQAMQTLRKQAENAAQYAKQLCILGESGVGKDAIARYIHLASTRADRPLRKCSLNALSAETILSTLFGQQDGDQINRGLLELSQGSTLLLGHISMLPPEAQQALQNALIEGSFSRIGGEESIPLQLTIIAASDHDVAQDVSDGTFLKSLWQNLSTVPIIVPALKEHAEDVPELLKHYVLQFNSVEGLPYREFTLAAQNFLRNYNWPGNLLELKNLVHRLLILGTEVEIDLDEVEEAVGNLLLLPNEQSDSAIPTHLYDMPLRQAREQFEHDYLIHQLEKAEGNVSKLADIVKMERTHLYRKMRLLGVDPKKYGR